MGIEIQFATVKPMKKNTLVKKVIWMFIAIIIIVNLIGLYLGNVLYKKVTNVTNNKTISEYDKYKTTFNEKRYERLYKRDVSLDSKHGYKVNGTYIRCDGDSNNTIILLHDINESRWSVMKYADIYLSRGFNILIYDAKGHGESGSNGTTLGYYEKDDLDLMVDYIYSGNKRGIIGVQGEGLGGFTALLQSELNKKSKEVNFYIIDSSISNVQDYLTLTVNKELNIKSSLLVKPIIFYANVINFYKSKFILSKIAVMDTINDISTPMLFISEKNDPDIPTSMTNALYKAKKNPKQIYISNSNKHDGAYDANIDEYKKVISDFINGNMK